MKIKIPKYVLNSGAHSGLSTHHDHQTIINQSPTKKLIYEYDVKAVLSKLLSKYSSHFGCLRGQSWSWGGRPILRLALHHA